MHTLALILIGVSGVSIFLFGLAILSTLTRTRRRPKIAADLVLPAISLLKPLKGIEESLELNLRSFYEQDYASPMEVVFSTTDAADPALEVARRVAVDYPKVETRFVLSDDTFGLNPKVANLEGALKGAMHELVLQSDANVRVESDYLRRMVSEMLSEHAHLTSSLVVGVGERSVGAALHNLQLCVFTAPGSCFALELFQISCVIGKSMLFRKSDLADVGGLELVRNILAEDYVLGTAFEEAGKKVLLSSTCVQNVNENVSVEHFLARHARWLKMRAVVHIPGFIGDLLTNPSALALLAWPLSGFDFRFLAAALVVVLLKAAGDAWLIHLTRGYGFKARYYLLSPIRDLLLLAIWPYAAFSRSVRWRGIKLRLGWKTVLRPARGRLRRWARRSTI